jgi:hypothetical protein
LLLAALAAESAQNAKDRSDPPLEDGEGAWSAAECVVLEMVACEVDRKVDLSARYLSAEDDLQTVLWTGGCGKSSEHRGRPVIRGCHSVKSLYGVSAPRCHRLHGLKGRSVGRPSVRR